MKKLQLGMPAGTLFGLLDGLTGFLFPGAEGMLTTIIVGSTVKGLVGGLIVGVLARRSPSVQRVTLWGGLVGLLLSVLAAIPTGASVEILVPGIIVGLLTGFVSGR